MTGDHLQRAGLQPERTLLSWTRTLLALVVAALLLVRVVGPPYVRLAHLPAGVVLVASLVLFLLADGRYRQQRPRRASATAVAVVAAATTLVGVVAVLALLV